MKNIFMYSLFVFGALLVIKGVFNFFPFEIRSNENSSDAYNYGHTIGYVIGKFAEIALGLMIINYGYEAYLKRKIVK
ncbi:hypothetical protein [Flavobacterium sp. LB2P74]|uniref:hypothetical protein n=1 Tax=Flavobacterium sp. LB2P74 TaxID=3401717 RepID=UPI003AADB36C